MKVLENWMVNLDVLPGSSQAELSKQASAQIGEKGYVYYLSHASLLFLYSVHFSPP